MRVYFHRLALESHRSMKRVAELILAIDRCGVTVTTTLDTSCDIAFCGAFESSGSFLEAVWREDRYRAERDIPPVKTVHFCWDMYPWKVNGDDPAWGRYVEDLKRCTAILVPSRAAGKRVTEFCKRESSVVLAACNPFEAEPFDGGWVVDVMRPYAGDPNTGLVKSVCDELGIPCVETRAGLPREEFERTVAGARLLVSAYFEASTGGLTLLEGYRLGKVVLLSDSKYNGATEYFHGTERHTFVWNKRESLKYHIDGIFKAGEGKVKSSLTHAHRAWVDERYSDTAFSQRIASEFRRITQ